MKYRILMEEKRRVYTTPSVDAVSQNEEWVEVDSMQSDSPHTIAGTLRAIADRLDPPAKQY